MRTHYIILSVALVFALLMFTGCGDSNGTEGATRSLGTMTGLVTSIIDNSIIPNATIEIWSTPIETFPPADTVGGEIKLLGITNATGDYIASVPVGKIWIRADAAAFKRSPPKGWALAPNATGTLNFVLYPGEGDEPFDPPAGFDVTDDGDGMEAFDPCFPGFIRNGPHDDRKCGGK
jgi:hypothetical protein